MIYFRKRWLSRTVLQHSHVKAGHSFYMFFCSYLNMRKISLSFPKYGTISEDRISMILKSLTNLIPGPSLAIAMISQLLIYNNAPRRLHDIYIATGCSTVNMCAKFENFVCKMAIKVYMLLERNRWQNNRTKQ